MVLLGLITRPSHAQEQPAPKPIDQEIVITATRHPSDPMEIPAHTTVITRDEIAKSGARTLVDLLKTRSGLFATANSSTPHDRTLDLRGFVNGGGNGQHILVMVDGRKTNSVTGSVTDWAQFPLENIERIEIVRGPLAGLQGDTALAGTINIITRSGDATPQRNITAEGGSFKTLRESGSALGRSGPLAYAVLIQGENSDGFRDNSEYNGRNGSLKLAYDLNEKMTLSLRSALHADDRERPGSLTKDEIIMYGRTGTTTLGDESDVDDVNVDLGAEIRFGDAGTLSLLLARGNEKAEAKTTFAGGTVASDDDATIDQVQIKHVVPLSLLGGGHLLVSGLDFGWEDADTASFNDFPGWVTDQSIDYKRRTFGAYSRLETKVLRFAHVSFGVRLDRATLEYERTTDNLTMATTDTIEGSSGIDFWNPHAGVIVPVAEKTGLYVNWGRTFRYPNRDELVGFLSSALELDAERASTWELGVKSSASRWLSGSLAFFTMDVKDEIFYRPPAVGTDVFATFDFGQNENLPRTRHRGIEAELESQLAERVRLFANWTLQKTTIEQGPFNGNDMPVSPRHSGTIGTTVTPMDHLDLTLSTRYAGSRYLANDLSNDISRLGGYWVLDSRIAYQWDRVTVYLLGNNILDREYFDWGGIGAGSTGIWGARQAFYPATERNFLIGASVDF